MKIIILMDYLVVKHNIIVAILDNLKIFKNREKNMSKLNNIKRKKYFFTFFIIKSMGLVANINTL